MRHSILELTLVSWICFARVVECAFALPLVVLVLALIPQSISVVVLALAVLHAIVEVAFVSAGGLHQDSLSVKLVQLEGPLVLVSSVIPS